MLSLIGLIESKAYAQTVGTNIEDPLNGQVTNLSNVYAFIFNLILGIGWAFVFIMTAVNISRYIMSKGEPKEVATTQTAFYYLAAAGFGLLLISTSKTIIMKLLGITSINTGPETNFIGP